MARRKTNTVANLAQRIFQERQQRACDYCKSIEAMTGTSNCPIHNAAPPPITAHPDREWGHRIDAQRVTLQFAQASNRPMDTGKLPMDESPLFGGRRQKSLFDDGGSAQ